MYFPPHTCHQTTLLALRRTQQTETREERVIRRKTKIKRNRKQTPHASRNRRKMWYAHRHLSQSDLREGHGSHDVMSLTSLVASSNMLLPLQTKHTRRREKLGLVMPARLLWRRLIHPGPNPNNKLCRLLLAQVGTITTVSPYRTPCPT